LTSQSAVPGDPATREAPREDPGPLSGAAGLTPEWLTRALAPELGGAEVTALRGEPIGTGQVAATVRLTVEYSGPVRLPATMVAKVPSADPASRAAARAVRTYETEARFYAEIAPGLEAGIPRCFYTAYEAEADDYVVLLEDLAPALPGDQLAGLTPDQARAAVAELAVLHAAGWERPALAELGWLNRRDAEGPGVGDMVTGLYEGFRERYAERLAPETAGLLDGFIARVGAFLSPRGGPATLVHGDFRADNLMFGGPRPVVLDWQSCAIGPGAADLAYFLGASLLVTDRRTHEESLVRHYHAALAERGVRIGWEYCWDEYRRYAFSGIIMAIVASMLVGRTERGDRMFCAMTDRHARHALDLDSLALLDEGR
jgi:aminoglycoside phosphotransferase (APT) family kinase protein